MDNHDYEIENDAHETKGLWAGLLAALLVGLVIGGLAGALVMLLLAPRSGKKTRARLQRQSRDLREQTVETVDDALGQARDKARQITHEVLK